MWDEIKKAYDELLPDKSPGLDIICNGIIHGSESIYPKEIVATKS